MDKEPVPDFRHLVVNRGDPPSQTVLPTPRRAQVTAQVYGGQVVTLDLDVVAVARNMVCVSQDRPGLSPWLAWIPTQQTRRI